MPSQSLSLLDSAATLSWLISLDVSLFFPDTDLMLASLLALPSLDLELPTGRDYDLMVKTDTRDGPLGSSPGLTTPWLCDLSQLLNLSGQRVSPSSVRANNTYLRLSAQN